MHSRGGRRPQLAAETESADELPVSFGILAVDVAEQATAPTDHLQQTAFAAKVVRMHLRVIGYGVDARRQNRDLHIGRADVKFVDPEILDQLTLLLGINRHSLVLPAPRGVAARTPNFSQCETSV